MAADRGEVRAVKRGTKKGGKGTRLKGGQQSGDEGDQKQNCDSSKPLPGFNFSFSERRLVNNLVARMRGEGSCVIDCKINGSPASARPT